MKKVYLIIGIIVAGVIATLIFFKMRSSSLEKTIEKVKSYDQYQLTCQMDMIENDELKKYQVNVSYLLSNKHEYIKVELFDQSLNQSQMIIKNKEGIFVLTPTLNQIFKFQSNWPHNSPKPYIYSSLIDLLEKGKPEKTKEGYKVTKKIKYPNDNRIIKQEEIFDKRLKPIRVTAYDQQGSEIIKVNFTSFKTNTHLKTKDFDPQSSLKESQEETNVSKIMDLPIYPVALMGSSLSDETVSSQDDKVSHVLKFTGEKNYTIIESKNKQQHSEVSAIEGDIIDFVDGFAYYQDGKMTTYKDGIEVSIYSHDLTKQEMLNVIHSMQSSSIK